MTTNCIKWANN